ncbi:MAG: hypothetical protein QOF35_1115, partial [Actinomycetota bacterium]|nr:hypothetical protein [Actinomycetota bacterium]
MACASGLQGILARYAVAIPFDERKASVQIALVSTSPIAAQARATVRSAFDADPTCTVYVLDLDEGYRPVANEKVVTPRDVGVGTREHHIRAVLLEPEALVRWMLPAILRYALRSGPSVLAVSSGVLLLRDSSELTDLATEHQTCLIARSPQALPSDGSWPGSADLLAAGSYTPHLLAVSHEATAFVDLWERLAADPRTASDRWLDVAASHLGHHTVHAPGFLVSAWTGPLVQIGENADGALEVDGVPAVALDLTEVDADSPWLLQPQTDRPPRIRL